MIYKELELLPSYTPYYVIDQLKIYLDEPNKEKNGWYLFQGVIGMVNLARTDRLITGFQSLKLKRILKKLK